MSPLDPNLAQRLRADLQRLFRGRLDQVILFGSRARGDARADSDYDLAVVLDPMKGLWAESESLARWQLELLDEQGVLVHAIPMRLADLQAQTGFMSELRRDGVSL